MALRRTDVDPEVIIAERAELLTQQQEDQENPSTDSILVYHRASKTGTWKTRSGRITTQCKSRIEIEEILYLMERASITCLDEDNKRLSVREMYAELVSSEIISDTIAVNDEATLRNYIAYGHLRRSGYKVKRSSDNFQWKVEDSKSSVFGLRVTKPRELIDFKTPREEHLCIVDLGKVAFLKLKVTDSAPLASSHI